MAIIQVKNNCSFITTYPRFPDSRIVICAIDGVLGENIVGGEQKINSAGVSLVDSLISAGNSMFDASPLFISTNTEKDRQEVTRFITKLMVNNELRADVDGSFWLSCRDTDEKYTDYEYKVKEVTELLSSPAAPKDLVAYYIDADPIACINIDNLNLGINVITYGAGGMK